MYYISIFQRILSGLIATLLLAIPAVRAQEALVKKADLLFDSAVVVFNNNMESAALLINESMPLYESAGDWGNYIKCLNGLTSIYYYQNDLEKYKRYAGLTYEKAKQHLSPEHRQLADAINNLYAYYYQIGNYDEAIELLQESLQIKEKNKEPKIELAIPYQNLANVYRSKGDFEKALEYMNKALEFTLDSLPSQHHRVAEIYDGMGLIYSAFEEIDSALVYHNKSLDLLAFNELKEDSRSYRLTIEVLHWLGELWIKKKDFAKASYYIKKALGLQAKDEDYRKSFSFELLCQIEIEKKNYPQALQLINKAVGIASTFDKENTPPFIARRCVKKAEIFRLLKQPQKALTQYQKGLQILSPEFVSNDFIDNPNIPQTLSPQYAFNVLQNKAETLWLLATDKDDSSLLKATFNTYLAASQLIHTIRQGIITTEAKNILSEKSVPVYEGAIRCALTLFEKTGQQSYLENAFYLAESNKALLLLESINEQTAKGLAGIPDSLLEQEKNLKLNLAYLQKTLLERKAEGGSVQNIADQIFSVQQNLERLIARFEKKYPRYFEAKYQNEPIVLTALQARLAKPKTTLLEYFVGEEAIYLFVLDAKEIHVLELENRDAVLEAIGQLQNLLQQPPGSDDGTLAYQQLTHTSHWLYTQLVAPARELLPDNLADLLVVPDHLLNFVPFELLLTHAPDQNTRGFSLSQLDYLMEEYVISYDYSATLYTKTQRKDKQIYDRDFVGFAPSFKAIDSQASVRSCDTEALYDLSCSHQEVNSIQHLLGGEAILKAAANKQAFEKQTQGSRIIHLATHACIDEENPLFNKIFLTDDYLTNADLYNLHLDAELTVLSACNTGSGKLIQGEGVMSLARGFITAGCASTVVSRWSVNDCATSEIMLYFYEQLQKGVPKNEALRQAKISYLQFADKTRTHPYYWAAFVQFGNVEAMAFDGSFLGIYILGFLAILVVFFAGGYFKKESRTFKN